MKKTQFLVTVLSLLIFAGASLPSSVMAGPCGRDVRYDENYSFAVRAPNVPDQYKTAVSALVLKHLTKSLKRYNGPNTFIRVRFGSGAQDFKVYVSGREGPLATELYRISANDSAHKAVAAALAELVNKQELATVFENPRIAERVETEAAVCM